MSCRFYQHVPNSSEWQWGLAWGHAKSQDLVNWEHLPVALEPTPHGLDQHGCFSGCATVDLDGRPSLLYTGVSSDWCWCCSGMQVTNSQCEMDVAGMLAVCLAKASAQRF